MLYIHGAVDDEPEIGGRKEVNLLENNDTLICWNAYTSYVLFVCIQIQMFGIALLAFVCFDAGFSGSALLKRRFTSQIHARTCAWDRTDGLARVHARAHAHVNI